MAVSAIQIIRAVSGGQCSLRSLPALELIRNDKGEATYYIGNSVVLFLVIIEGRAHALRCYTSKSPYRKAIYGPCLKERELYIPLYMDRGEWIDVTLSEWVEGITLGQYIEECVAANDTSALASLSASFDSWALNLLSEESAHGDITCDNIIIDNALRLHSIDFDATFLPEFAGNKSIELGTQAYQHPTRCVNHFDRHIDDYSLALISTALSVLALDTTLYNKYHFSEGLLYDPAEAATGRSEALEHSLNLLASSGKPFAYAIARMLLTPSYRLEELWPIMRYKCEGINPQAVASTPFCRDGLWGYLNERGREVIPPLFAAAFTFRESLAAVQLGSTWHYINSQATVVVNGKQYQQLKSFRNGCGAGLTPSGWVPIALPEKL